MLKKRGKGKEDGFPREVLLTPSLLSHHSVEVN